MRPDYGRLVMIPVAALWLTVDGISLLHARGARLLTAVPVTLFYALVIWCYARRGRAIATSGRASAHVAAVACTCAPFAFPLLAGPPGSGVRSWAGAALVAAGVGWSLWSLWALGRNVSVIAQARRIVDRGPYRWVRHPLYTGEIVSSFGLAVLAWTPAAFGLWAGFCALQAYRARCEERLLLAELPGYRGYRARTAALLPGLR